MNQLAPQAQIKLLRPQFNTLYSKAFCPVLVGGIGSGKSYTGAWRCIMNARINPHSAGFIGANSYKQLNKATLKTLFDVCKRWHIPYTYKKTDGLLWIGTKMFHCYSMDNFDSFRGIEISDFWIDEVRDTKEEAVTTLLGRMRDKTGNPRFNGLMTTSPAGYNWLHDWLVVNPKEGYELIRATSFDNHHLPDHYINMLKGAYDPKMMRQEVYGEFINVISNSIYYAFDRNIHVESFERERDEQGNDKYPLKIGMDFNVNPMTAVVGWATHDTIYIYDEVWLGDSNTYKTADELIKKGYAGLKLIPDGTGSSRKSSAESGKTDFIILKDKGFDVVKTHNPHVADRYNCVNGLLDKARIVIHPRCVKLIKDLEQMARDNDDPLLSHISDAFGYLCWHFFPIKRISEIRQYKYK